MTPGPLPTFLEPALTDLRQGRFELAASGFAAARGRSGVTGWAELGLAQAELGRGLARVHAEDHAGARACFEAALRHHPGEVRAGRLLARALHRAGDPESALRTLDGVSARAVEGLRTRLLRAVCLEALGDRDAARRALDRALAMAWGRPVARDSDPARALWSEPHRGREREHEDDTDVEPRYPDERCRIALRILPRRPDRAVRQLEAALARNPSFLRARIALGLARLDQGRPLQALEQLSRARELEPSYPDVQAWIGLARLRAGDARGAVVALEGAVASRREFARAHRTLALALHALGRTTEALRAARRGLVREREAHPPPAPLGLPGFEADVAADDELTRTLAIRPDAPELHLAWGLRLRARGDRAAAARAFRSALGLQPQYASAVLELARCELALGHPQAAESLLSSLTRRRPTWADAQALLGRIRLILGNADGAVAPLRAALRAQPELAPARADLAWALLSLPRSIRARGREPSTGSVLSYPCGR